MITITDTDLEVTLKSLLQKKVDFIIHKKHLKSGKFLLFKQSGFYIEIVIKNNKGKIERFEIPIPFDIIHKSDCVVFSYEFSALVCNKQNIIDEIKQIEKGCKNKYFNSCLEIYIS